MTSNTIVRLNYRFRSEGSKVSGGLQFLETISELFGVKHV